MYNKTIDCITNVLQMFTQNGHKRESQAVRFSVISRVKGVVIHK